MHPIQFEVTPKNSKISSKFHPDASPIPSSTILRLTYRLNLKCIVITYFYMLSCSDSPKMMSHPCLYYFWRIQHAHSGIFEEFEQHRLYVMTFVLNNSSSIDYLTLLRSQHVYPLRN